MYHFIQRAAWGNQKRQKRRLADPAADLLCLMALALILLAITIVSLITPLMYS